MPLISLSLFSDPNLTPLTMQTWTCDLFSHATLRPKWRGGIGSNIPIMLCSMLPIPRDVMCVVDNHDDCDEEQYDSFTECVLVKSVALVLIRSQGAILCGYNNFN